MLPPRKQEIYRTLSANLVRHKPLLAEEMFYEIFCYLDPNFHQAMHACVLGYMRYQNLYLEAANPNLFFDPSLDTYRNDTSLPCTFFPRLRQRRSMSIW